MRAWLLAQRAWRSCSDTWAPAGSGSRSATKKTHEIARMASQKHDERRQPSTPGRLARCFLLRTGIGRRDAAAVERVQVILRDVPAARQRGERAAAGALVGDLHALRVVPGLRIIRID